jgi:hypothetical protein
VASIYDISQTFPGPAKVIVRRDLTPADGATLPPLDFSGAEAVNATVARLTFLNAGASPISAATWFSTGSDMGTIIGSPAGSVIPDQYAGVPLALLDADDGHALQIIARDPVPRANNELRSVTLYFRAVIDRTVDLGPVISMPTITTLAGSPVIRPRAQVVRQSEYGDAISVLFQQNDEPPLDATNRSVSVSYLREYFTTPPATWDLQVPDLSNVPGFDPAWGLTPGVPITWTVTGSSGNHGFEESAAAKGVVFRSSYRKG